MLSALSLYHYRNYTQQSFSFPKSLTIILGNNGQGKTNLLEAITFFSLGQSFRGNTIDDCIQLDQEYAQVKGGIKKNNEQLEATLLLNHGRIQGKRTAKLRLSINEVNKSRKALVGLLPTVTFLPEDLRIITGSPSRRRQFLDDLLLQLDSEYRFHLTQYTQSLKRRNKVLEHIRDHGVPRTNLTFWTKAILKHGQAVQSARQELIEKLDDIRFPLKITMDYQPSVMSEARLAKYAAAEVATARTLVGPQKDDFIIKLQVTSSKLQHPQSPTFNPQPLQSHGSRGQQRLGVFWLKLGAFELLKNQYQTPPLLLLDDIFSELDDQHRQMVLELIDQTQTILTSAETSVIDDFPELQKASIITL